MISKLVFLTGFVLSHSVFATETASTQDTLNIAAISHQKGLFNVRELHDMGVSGVQQIDYVVNCSNQTLALSGFAIMTAKARLSSKEPTTDSASLNFYKPVIEHDQKIASRVCNNLVTMNSTASQ